MRRTNHPGSRGGFTLVELLVVVTIIAVLVGLISSGVIAALQRGSEVQARNEVMQLANGVQAFKAQFQVQYVPDQLVLPPSGDQTGATAVFLKQVWPRLHPGTLGTMPFTINGRQTEPYTYWQVSPKGGPQTLHG